MVVSSHGDKATPLGHEVAEQTSLAIPKKCV